MKNFFFYLGLLSRTFMIHRRAGKGRGYLFNFSLPLPMSLTLRYYPGDYSRELTSTHSQQPDSFGEPLVSERKSLTTKLRAWNSHLTKQPKSYKNIESPSCTDLILTNKAKPFQSTYAIETGLSDFHRMTISVLKMCFRKLLPKGTSYRDF